VKLAIRVVGGLALSLLLLAGATLVSATPSTIAARTSGSFYSYDPISTSTTSAPNVAFATAAGDPTPSESSGAVGVAFRSFSAAEDGAAAANPLTNTMYSQKVLDQMAQGDYHAFPESVDGFADQSQVTTELGGDGSPYTHVRIPGGFGSDEGVFHYIFGDNGVITHRLFEPTG
jgi:hypothetical protein